MSFSARSGQAQTTPSLSPADNVMSRLHQLGMLSSESGALTRLYLTPSTRPPPLSCGAGWRKPG